MTAIIRYYRKHTAIPIEKQEGGIIQHNKAADKDSFKLSPNVVEDDQWHGSTEIKELTPKEEHPNYWIFDMPKSLEVCHVMINRLTVWGLMHNFDDNIPYAINELAKNSEYQEVLHNYAGFLKKRPDLSQSEESFIFKLENNTLNAEDITIMAEDCRNRYTSQCNTALNLLEKKLEQHGCEDILFEAHDVISTGIRSKRDGTVNSLIIHTAVADAEDIKKVPCGSKTVWDYPYFTNTFKEMGTYDLTAVHKSKSSQFKLSLTQLCKDAGATPNVQEFVIGMPRASQRDELTVAKQKNSSLFHDIKQFCKDGEIKLFTGGRADLNKGCDQLIQQLDKLLNEHSELKEKVKVVCLLQKTHTTAPGYQCHADKDIIPAVQKFEKNHPGVLYFQLNNNIDHGQYLQVMQSCNSAVFAAKNGRGDGHNLHVAEIGAVRNEPQAAMEQGGLNAVFAGLNAMRRRLSGYRQGAEVDHFNGFIVTTSNIGAAEVYGDAVFVANCMEDVADTIWKAINTPNHEKAKKLGKLMALTEQYNAASNAEQLTRLALHER